MTRAKKETFFNATGVNSQEGMTILNRHTEIRDTKRLKQKYLNWKEKQTNPELEMEIATSLN